MAAHLEEARGACSAVSTGTGCSFGVPDWLATKRHRLRKHHEWRVSGMAKAASGLHARKRQGSLQAACLAAAMSQVLFICVQRLPAHLHAQDYRHPQCIFKCKGVNIWKW